MHQKQERMLGAIGIPQGEYGIVVPTVSMVDSSVQAPVSPVHIVIYGRINHCVVEGGVEHPEFVPAPLSLYLSKFPFP